MKRIIPSILSAVLLSASLISTLAAQIDVLTAVVRSDTVTVWNNNVYYPCGASFVVTASRYLQTITIIEQDTSSMHATCMCYYQISADIAGLAAGDYEAVVHRRFRMYLVGGATRDTMYEVGRLNFTVAAQGGRFAVRGYQAPCQPFASVPARRVETAEDFSLGNAYPNPFNGTTRIRLHVPGRRSVVLSVYDIAGRMVSRLGEGLHEPGTYTYVWEPGPLPSGLYLIRAEAGEISAAAKVVYLK